MLIDNKHFISCIKNRLPGGIVYEDLMSMDNRHGLHVSLKQLCHHFELFLLGSRFAKGNQQITEIKHPVRNLYHFASASTVESIMAKGLLAYRDYVYLSDRNDERWIKRFSYDEVVCFHIDTERLLKLGHRLFIMNRFHEYTTDYVPPECLTLLD